MIYNSGFQGQRVYFHVPSGGNVVCVGRPRPYFPGETKVGDLDELGAHTEEIFRLHVPVKEAVLVHESQTLEHLVDHVPDYGLGEELVPVFHQLVEVFLHILEDKVKNVVLPDDFLQLDDVCVAKLLQGLDLPQVHSLLPGVVLSLHSLDRDLLPGVDSLAQDHRAEGPITQLVQLDVPVHRHRRGVGIL